MSSKDTKPAASDLADDDAGVGKRKNAAEADARNERDVRDDVRDDVQDDVQDDSDAKAETGGEARQAKAAVTTKSKTKRRAGDTKVETDVTSDSKSDKDLEATSARGKPSAAVDGSRVDRDADTDGAEPDAGARLDLGRFVSRARDWTSERVRSLRDGADADVDTDVDTDVDGDDASEPERIADIDADDMRRFLDSRRPWLRPITKRDRRRRVGGLYWSLVYVLLMAGATSLIGFIVVRGYLILWPGPTASGASVARQVVPWVFFAITLAFAVYVTRSARRTIGYAALFLLPYLVFLFVREATDLALWLVGWIPGNGQVYGLAALGPFIAFVLLGRDFVRWQLWVEFPNDSCWECGTVVANDTWSFCPTCGADLQEQRYAQAEDERADEIDITEGSRIDAGKKPDRSRSGRNAADDAPFDFEAGDDAAVSKAAKT